MSRFELNQEVFYKGNRGKTLEDRIAKVVALRNDGLIEVTFDRSVYICTCSEDSFIPMDGYPEFEEEFTDLYLNEDHSEEPTPRVCSGLQDHR